MWDLFALNLFFVFLSFPICCPLSLFVSPPFSLSSVSPSSLLLCPPSIRLLFFLSTLQSPRRMWARPSMERPCWRARCAPRCWTATARTTTWTGASRDTPSRTCTTRASRSRWASPPSSTPSGSSCGTETLGNAVILCEIAKSLMQCWVQDQSWSRLFLVLVLILVLSYVQSLWDFHSCAWSWSRHLWGALHQAFCQCFSLTNFISYWNPCIWLAESKFVSEKHWQNAWWNAPQVSTPTLFQWHRIQSSWHFPFWRNDF